MSATRIDHGACGEREQRTNALAAAEHGVAHRFVQSRRRYMRRRKETRERVLHAGLDFAHLVTPLKPQGLTRRALQKSRKAAGFPLGPVPPSSWGEA